MLPVVFQVSREDYFSTFYLLSSVDRDAVDGLDGILGAIGETGDVDDLSGGICRDGLVEPVILTVNPRAQLPRLGDGEPGLFDLVFLVHGVSEDELEIVEAEVGGEAFIAEHVGDELGFLVLKDTDLFLDGVAGEESIGDHLVFLADPVGSVDGLVFDGGVPPWIVEDDIRCRGEVEAGTTRFEREHEDGWVLGGLEFLDFAFAILGLAGEVIVRAVVELEARLDEVEHGDELRENQNLVPFFVELIE